MAISVIIPSYKNPEYLDLCLRSAYENQVNENQIIVVLDGYADLSANVIAKYKGLDVIAFEQNQGQTKAHNTGVTLAEHDKVLLVNDDNVFGNKWDKYLEEAYDEKKVIAPNQCEPNPSIFRSFITCNLGTTPATFDYDKWLQYEGEMSVDSPKSSQWRPDGQTWPLFMSKKWYMILGGIDPYFPSPAVADWDFFFRCELAGLECVRYLGTHFYHFAGAATKRPDSVQAHTQGEQDSQQYFYWKWGFAAGLDQNHNKRPVEGAIRGFTI